MLHSLIAAKTAAWFEKPDCPVRHLIAHMESAGNLRNAQIEAIKTYLFLKIAGQNRPLYQLFCDGFFTAGDLSTVPLSEAARARLQTDTPARALLAFSRQTDNNKTLLPEVEKRLTGDAPHALDCDAIIKRLFYGVSYSDYLFSLPMGAGKTFLMAAFICLDLYFAQNEPNNPAWAHNFLLLVPSGLKSSILPSLRTVENFDPAWVLPEPAASGIRKMLRFEILDQAKTGAKSNKSRNPNAQKIAQYQPFDDLMGLVVVTNAEKVVLDKVAVDAQGVLIEPTDDEKNKAENELRYFIGKLPHLQILIDEVHHAATDDIKLRGVVNRWTESGSITGVCGFSGTPYLSAPEKLEFAPGVSAKFAQITNTVFYYPLLRAVEAFLKKPAIITMKQLSSSEIVARGVDEFLAAYGGKTYHDGTIAKLAIYCGTVKRLEEEIYPLLLRRGIAADTVLKYYSETNVNAYKLAPDAHAQWRNLDTRLSRKRFILLVQIGKEGWDCRSLTGVVLSQKDDCPPNMVLQTGCRCLRQMDGPPNDTARIWLNEQNAAILNKQLIDTQNTSIEEINHAGKTASVPPTRPRYDRTDALALPLVPFYQMRVTYDTVTETDPRPPADALADLCEVAQAGTFRRTASSTEHSLTNGLQSQRFHDTEYGEPADYSDFLLGIVKGGLNGRVHLPDLAPLNAPLRKLFDTITATDESGVLRYNVLFDRDEIAARARLAFYATRTLHSVEDVFAKNARLLIAQKLGVTVSSTAKNLYPSEADTEQIIALDQNQQSAGAAERAQQAEFAKRQADVEAARKLLAASGMADIALPTPEAPAALPLPVLSKDRAFQYVPYQFDSTFERDFMEQALAQKALRDKNLELYFNGAGELTEFRISCFVKTAGGWGRVGEYTPDFLLVERRENAIYRALIIETKGSGFADQKTFTARRAFTVDHFVPVNNEKFGYERFQYLYLSDADDLDNNLKKLCDAAAAFFTDAPPLVK